LIGVFSRLARWKGQHIVLQALKACPGVKCVIVGAALFGEDDYERELHALVRASGLSDRVFFLGHRPDAPSIMQAVDAMVHPSIDPEPFGLTLVEAMSVGTPVLASDAGASREILDDGRCGTLLAAGDADALSDAIRGLFAAPRHYQVKAEAAIERARTIYTVTAMQSAIAQVIIAQAVVRRANEVRACSR
jgi:glycosyltransferase involved in cell wall biosynthesis